MKSTFINKKLGILLPVLFFCILFPSCKKFITVAPAPSLVQTAAVFTNENTALSAVDGVYSTLRSGNQNFCNAGLSIYGSLLADELSPVNPSASTSPFYENQLIATNTTCNGFYSSLYQGIYRTNAILEGLDASVSISASVKVQLEGEMKFTRAFLYFYLVNLWGDVPLITSTDYEHNAAAARTNVNDVYTQIIKDLEEAKQELNENYPSDGRARPNKWAATALLARVWLFRQEWQKATSEASSVINSGLYTLLPSSSIKDVFLKNSPETIWELASPSEAQVVGDAANFVPSSSSLKPTYVLSTFLRNSFEPGDLRNQTNGWVGKNIIASIPYYYPFKYKQRSYSTGGTITEYKVVMRIAEQYLIRAEARLHLQDITGARSDLNIIRNRAGLPDSNASDSSGLFKAILKERQTEFFMEWAFRWLDLNRTNLADSILPDEKGSNNWQPTDHLLPIPANELLYNPNLIQNPGY